MDKSEIEEVEIGERKPPILRPKPAKVKPAFYEGNDDHKPFDAQDGYRDDDRTDGMAEQTTISK